MDHGVNKFAELMDSGQAFALINLDALEGLVPENNIEFGFHTFIKYIPLVRSVALT